MNAEILLIAHIVRIPFRTPPLRYIPPIFAEDSRLHPEGKFLAGNKTPAFVEIQMCWGRLHQDK